MLTYLILVLVNDFGQRETTVLAHDGINIKKHPYLIINQNRLTLFKLQVSGHCNFPSTIRCLNCGLYHPNHLQAQIVLQFVFKC